METHSIRTGPALAVDPPPDKKAPPLTGNDAAHLLHDDDADATGARMFRDRLASALLPLTTESFHAEIEHAEAEARADELLQKRLAAKGGK